MIQRLSMIRRSKMLPYFFGLDQWFIQYTSIVFLLMRLSPQILEKAGHLKYAPFVE